MTPPSSRYPGPYPPRATNVFAKSTKILFGSVQPDGAEQRSRALSSSVGSHHI